MRLPFILNKKLFSITIVISVLLASCIFGAGTHGHIKSFYMDYTKEEIASIVDQFLVKHKDYYDNDIYSYENWVHIKIPSTNDRFVFRIGKISDKAEIDLVLANIENDYPKRYFELSRLEKIKLINSFKNNFIDKLKEIKPSNINLEINPLTLTLNVNMDSTLWPDYFIKQDIFATYPLPKELNKKNIDCFTDLVESYSNTYKMNIKINQYCNLFRINEDYTGYINDSIHIISSYRRVGEPKKENILFDDKKWIDYIKDSYQKKRELECKNNRLKNIKENTKEIDIYRDYLQEYWMLKCNKIDTTKQDKSTVL